VYVNVGRVEGAGPSEVTFTPDVASVEIFGVVGSNVEPGFVAIFTVVGATTPRGPATITPRVTLPGNTTCTGPPGAVLTFLGNETIAGIGVHPN
jgi:hypothetical protein